MNDPSPPVTKVRALLDKAESTAFPEEAEALVAKAAELMARYRITQAMLDAGPGRHGGPESIVEHRIEIGRGPYVLARLALLSVCAASQSARVLTTTGWEGRIAIVIGHVSDTQSVEVLYTSLLVQATLGSGRLAPTGRSATVTVRRNYLLGFAEAIGERLAEVNARAQEETPVPPGVSGSVALVLADRSTRVDDWVRSSYPRLGRVDTITATRAGFSLGRADAQSADLHQSGLTRPSPAISA
ncbi:MAG: DUF2786 domain-containing protein [Acidimicrobiales bacterium]